MFNKDDLQNYVDCYLSPDAQETIKSYGNRALLQLRKAVDVVKTNTKDIRIGLGDVYLEARKDWQHLRERGVTRE